MDITPVTSRYYENVNTVLADFDQVHTCRDIRKLRDWKNERWSRHPAQQLRTPEEAGISASDVPAFGYVLNEDANKTWAQTYEGLI